MFIRNRPPLTNQNPEFKPFLFFSFFPAPIRSVNLEITRLSGYEEVKCSMYNVYPAPHVLWSTDPPLPTERLKYTTRKMPNKQGLYVIESKLKRLGQRSDLTYICTVNSSSAAQMWTVSLTETGLTLTYYTHAFIHIDVNLLL